MLYQKFMLPCLLVGIFLIPHSSSAANERFEMGKIKKEVQKSIISMSGSVEQSIKKVPRESRGIYQSIIKNQFSQIQSSVSYAYFLSDAEEDRSYIQQILSEIRGLQEEMKRDPLTKNVTEGEKKSIEAAILSHQKAFIDPILKEILPHITKGIKQKGNMNLQVETKFGNIELALRDYISKTDPTSGNFDISTTLGVKADITIPPTQDCDYDEDYNYICKEPTTATGRIIFRLSLPVQMIKDGSALYFHAKKADLIIESGTSLSKDETDSFQKMIEEYNDKYADKTYKTRLPNDFVVSEDSFKKQIETINTLQTTSILTPTYKNSTSYLLDWNPVFTKKIRSFSSIKKGIPSIAGSNIRYLTGGMVQYTDHSGYNNRTYAVTLGTESGISTIRFIQSGQWYGATSTASGLIQPTRISYIGKKTSSYGGSSDLTLDWNNKIFSLQSRDNDFEWTQNSFISPQEIVSESEKNKGFEIRGTLSLTDMDLVATFYTRKIAHLSARTIGNIITLDMGVNVPNLKIRLSSVIEEIFEKYIPNIPTNVIDLDDSTAPIEDLIDLSEKVSKKL